MKTLITLFAVLTTTIAFSQPVKPDFTCIEESGFTYEFYMSKFNEIQQFDENREFISMYDGINFDYLSIETYPSIDQYTVRYADGGNEIAIIEFPSNSKTGKGEMIDHDQTMVCERL